MSGVSIQSDVDGFRVKTNTGTVILPTWSDVIMFLADNPQPTTHRDVLNQFARDAHAVISSTLMNLNQFDLTDDRRRSIADEFLKWGLGWVEGLGDDFDKPVR